MRQKFDDLVYLLKCTNETFDIIAVGETRISKKISVIPIVNLNNYSLVSITSRWNSALYIQSLVL